MREPNTDPCASEQHPRLPGQGALGTVCLALAALGYLLGSSGWLTLPFVSSAGDLTPLVRVGSALSQNELAADPQAWEQLGQDLERVRRTLAESEREVFDLVIALHGLHDSEGPDWTLARELCDSLGWNQCTQKNLEQLRERNRR